MEVRNTTMSFAEREKVQPDRAKKAPVPLQVEISKRFSVMKGQPTPPDTPLKSLLRQSVVNDQPLFHNYLRAFCKYDPPANADGQDEALQLTVRIRPGDLILVHSVHANGWADGTVLTTNTRGWLPTNYCETFDHPYMRNLLNAMTQFWDLLGASHEANLSTFVRQDYIRPLIAGVRYLLEHADCLHRDAKLVQRSTGLHRLRKGLLADLSTLVQLAKSLQETVRAPYAEKEVLALLDQSMTKACKVVTRAVGFVDMLARETGELDPVVITKRTSPLHKVVSGLAGENNLSRTDSKTRISTQSSSYGGSAHIVHQEDRPARVRPQSGVTSHRLSTVKTERRSTSGTLASERLAQAHDLCISHIASFIGLYLHPSVPAAELVATTESLRRACTSMLEVVHQISAFEPHGQSSIQQAERKFQAKFDELQASIEKLVTDADSLDEDIVMLPERTDHLVSLGTSLIKRVGDCVVKIRKVIEQIGDFDLDKPPVVHEEEDVSLSGYQALPGAWPGAEEFAAVGILEADSRRASDQTEEASPTIRPSISSTEEGMLGSGDGVDLAKTASSNQAVLVATARRVPSGPLLVDVAPTDANTPNGDARKNSKSSQSLLVSPARKTSVGASISASTDDTQKSSMRDSDISAVSEVSTRATTPDHSKEKESRLLDSFSSVSSMHSTAVRDAGFDDVEAHLLQKTYANELTLNKDGQVTGGSLPALVEQLTTGDTAPDAQFVAAFFVTFRSFTTPRGLAKALIDRFDYAGESASVGTPIRIRVADALKSWLEVYWNMDLDKDALGDLRYFALHKLKPAMQAPADRLLDVIRKLSILYQSGGMNGHLANLNNKMANSGSRQEEKAPAPSISKSQLNTLRKAVAGEGTDCSILDLDALELARQLTVLASNIFCNIQPEELLSLEWNKKNSTKAENVRHMCTLNTDLAHFVGDTILTPEDAKKRALVIKHWSKVATRCLEFNNYESLMAIMCSINSSVVQRLKRTWEVVSKKTKSRIEELNTIVDFSRNQASLRRRLENVQTPCLPFLGIYLTDLTMIDAGNPKHRELPNATNSDSGATTIVINFDKHMRLAKIITHLQSFQSPYLLRPVPELQAWIGMHLDRMRGRQAQMVGEFHRRSLYIEPKRDLGTTSNVPLPRMPEGRKGTDPADRAAVDSSMSTNSSAGASRPKTPAGGQTINSFKPRGQTFEFLLKANFNFKGPQQKAENEKDLPPVPPISGPHDL